MDRYVLFSDHAFMKHHDIFFNFFFRLTHKAFLMPWACPGASMYYALRHAVFTSAFDIFLCSIICTSTTIIFIFWNFFHILYFETLPLPYYFCVILFANLLTSWVKKVCGSWQSAYFLPKIIRKAVWQSYSAHHCSSGHPVVYSQAVSVDMMQLQKIH